jgi:hypothetical protein
VTTAPSDWYLVIRCGSLAPQVVFFESLNAITRLCEDLADINTDLSAVCREKLK